MYVCIIYILVFNLKIKKKLNEQFLNLVMSFVIYILFLFLFSGTKEKKNNARMNFLVFIYIFYNENKNCFYKILVKI